MKNFHVGSKVVCIDLERRDVETKNYSLTERLQIGKTYVVREVHTNGTHVLLKKNGFWHVADRFRHEIEDPVEKLMYQMGYTN